MKFRRVFRAVQPFFSAIAVIATGGALVFTIYYTELGSQWTMFLGGVLVAAEAVRSQGQGRAPRGGRLLRDSPQSPASRPVAMPCDP